MSLTPKAFVTFSYTVDPRYETALHTAKEATATLWRVFPGLRITHDQTPSPGSTTPRVARVEGSDRFQVQTVATQLYRLLARIQGITHLEKEFPDEAGS